MDARARARLAASTGLLFSLTIAASAIVSEIKEFDRPGDLVLRASNEVFGTTTLLTGFAAIFFFWFTSALAARIRQLEGGSGRLAAALNGSGAIIAGVLSLSVGVSFAARNTGSEDLAALVTAMLDGPGLFFPAAVFLGAGSVVVLRTPGVPDYSMWTARLILPLAATYGALAGLQLFKNYAWINETAYISFIVTILVVSLIGINRWGEMDDTTPAERLLTGARPAPARASSAEEPDAEAPRPAGRKAKPKAKPRARKAAPRKR